MSTSHCVAFVFLTLVININCRCGLPELPLGIKEIGLKEVFEPNEDITITCVGGKVVPELKKEPPKLICDGTTWIGPTFRCTQLKAFNNVTIEVVTENETATEVQRSLEGAMIQQLTDKNPQTCVALENEQIWTVHLNKKSIIVNVVLIVTNHEEESLVHNHTFSNLTISVDGEDMCDIIEHTHGEDLPIIFIIYNCPSRYSNNMIIHLKGNGHLLNICDVDVFAIADEDCGNHEVPLYSAVNVFEIQNGSKMAEYTCSKGYSLVGSQIKTCGPDGLWHPRVQNYCVPKVVCEKFTAIGQEYDLHYRNLDLFGNAIPDVSSVEYQCINASEAFPKPMIQYCMANGSWSWIPTDTRHCQMKHELVPVDGHFIDGTMFVAIAVILLILLAAAAVLIFFNRKRLIRDMKAKWGERPKPRRIKPKH